MKIYSCFVFALLLVSYTLALEKSQPQTANENVKGAVDKVEPASGGWGGGGGGGCHHGCCYKGHYGCQKCCSSPEEAKAVAEKEANAEKSQPETANEVADKVEPAGGGGGGGGHWGGGGGGGGGCNHGCCYSGHYGCQRCCASPEEAKAVSQKQAHAEKSQPATTNEKMEGAADKVEPAGGGGGNWNGGGGGHWGGGGGSGGGGGHWGGGGGGGGCRHGCCGGGGYGCQRCCSSPEEAKAVAAKQVHP